MKSLFTIALLILSITISAQNYKQISIHISSPNDFIVLSQNGIDLEHSGLSKENNLNFFVSEDDLNKIISLGFNYSVLIDDWHAYYNSIQQLSIQEKNSYLLESKDYYNVDGFGFGSMGGYYTFAEIVANLDSMFAQYPNIITQKYSIGISQQSRTIWAVKISDNPNINENEIKVGYDALVHAREPQSMASMMYYMWYLLQNYGTDPEVTYLVDNRELYFVPCFNPDGYEYNRTTNPSGGGMWRKNRRINGDGSYGVDLNRNFGFAWGYDNIGSSNIPGDETYRGPSAFSEPESQAVRNLALLKNYRTHFNLHSYQNAFLYPWGYIDQQTPDSLTYREFASDMASYNGFTYGTSGEILGYQSNGSVRDWMYGEQTAKQKTFGYTVEIGSSSDNFWPPQSRIFPLAQAMLRPNLYNAWVAGAYVELVDAGLSEPFVDPGDVMLMNSIFKNKGLGTAYNLQLQISSLSTYLTVLVNTAQFDSIPSRSNASLTNPLSFSVSPSAPTDVTAKLLLTSSFSGTVVKQDTISFILGTPMFVFADTTNDPLLLWNVTATPANPKWEATNTAFYSSPTSFTDSKSGNYSSNATVTMSLKNSIDLTTYSNPRLTFWTKYDIESNWDYGQVEASTNNGSTWIPLQGLYTEPGTGSFQPGGEPLYDGLRTDWVKEEISLAGFNSNQFKLKFELKTDGSIVKDGWYVDDIGIIVYGIVPVELTSFTAQLINGKVKLNWQTASELNNAGFEIQKTVFSPQSSVGNDAKLKWTKVGFVTGKGTTTEINNYSFIDDELISQKVNYRLKQIDFDGTFSYSNEVEIDVTTPQTFSLEQNFPNPFNPETEITFSLAKSDNVTLKIYNILGSEVATVINEFIEAGKHSVKLNASNLTSGVYLYTIKSGNFTATRKMILMK
jgi:hypothetical protein